MKKKINTCVYLYIGYMCICWTRKKCKDQESCFGEKENMRKGIDRAALVRPSV